MNLNPKSREVPTINLSEPNLTTLSLEIARACSTHGFFQIINHTLPSETTCAFRTSMETFFLETSPEVKAQLKRHGSNSRGYFNDELTRQKRDWKECLDVGVPGWVERDWEEGSGERCGCLDGMNRFPENRVFKSAVVEYFEACEVLADRLARLMAMGLMLLRKERHSAANDEEGVTLDGGAEEMLDRLRDTHTSYLRLNHYPPCPSPSSLEDEEDNSQPNSDIPPLGISPHFDAGFLTILSQDDGCHSLQVLTHSDTNDNTESEDRWVTVQPLPGALTINTGDMAMIWSNGIFRAPLHRVLTHPTTRRYSAPFFYNPGYDMEIRPVGTTNTNTEINDEARYHPCVWGYFRAIRFAGDFTDFGAEIQISDYLKIGDSDGEESRPNQRAQQLLLQRQAEFVKKVPFDEPFDVVRYQSLIEK